MIVDDEKFAQALLEVGIKTTGVYDLVNTKVGYPVSIP